MRLFSQPLYALVAASSMSLVPVQLVQASVECPATCSPSGSDVSFFNDSTPGAVNSSAQVSDFADVDVGLRFSSSEKGLLTGLAYYYVANDNCNNDGVTGTLWKVTDSSDVDAVAAEMIASVTFGKPTATGWITAQFDCAQLIENDKDYIVTYRAIEGACYSYTYDYFDSAASIASPLTAPQGVNGVYNYNGDGSETFAVFKTTNYWVDLIFQKCNSNGGGGGDPHFARWGRERDSFHGECDLVMVQSNKFHNGAGLDLHVRTTLHSSFVYSYIESAALRVGDYILEIERSQFFVNGIQHSSQDLPLTLGGDYKYTITNLKNTNAVQLYEVDLHDHSSVTFKFYKHYLTIDISANPLEFNDSVGLLGEFSTGDMYGRDGKSMSNFEEYGLSGRFVLKILTSSFTIVPPSFLMNAAACPKQLVLHNAATYVRIASYLRRPTKLVPPSRVRTLGFVSVMS
eukprot:scaffold34660_cov175-Amphora_coffeaeformis.AAC.1